MTKRLSVFALFLTIVALQPHWSASAQKKGENKAPVVSATASIFNPRLAVQVGSDGRFNIGAFPNPVTGGALPGSFDLMYRWPQTPSTSFSTIRIDSANFRYGSSGVLVEPIPLRLA